MKEQVWGESPSLVLDFMSLTQTRQPRKVPGKHESAGPGRGDLEPLTYRWKFSHFPRVSVTPLPNRSTAPGPGGDLVRHCVQKDVASQCSFTSEPPCGHHKNNKRNY